MLILAAALLLATPARSAADEEAPPSHVEAGLISESGSIEPGGRTTLAVRLIAKDGWHTYWKNPGDSGMATRVAWKLPSGFSVGGLQWPVPERLVLPRVVDYGFPGEAVLLAELKTPPDLKPGTKFEIAAKVKWLECLKICLSGEAELHTSLRIGKPEPDAARKALFEKAGRSLPVPFGEGPFAGWKASATSGADRIELRVSPPTGSRAPKSAAFFPADNSSVSNAKPKVRSGPSGLVLELPRSATSGEASRLSGVLVFQGLAQAAEIDLAIPNTQRRKP